MTMPPSGIKSEMDEEAIIEAEIQQQLDLMDLDNDDVNNNIIDARNNILLVEDLEDQNDTNDEELVVDEAKDYLSRLQKQTERFENELNECDDLVNYYKPGDSGTIENFDELLEAAETSGVDPQELRKKILEAIEREDELGDAVNGDMPTDKDTSLSEDPVFVTSETGLLSGRQEEAEDHAEEFEESVTLEPGDGVVALVDEIQTQEEFFKQQLRDMEVKYRDRENKWKQESELRRKEEEEKENEENAKRQQILLRYAEEKEALEDQTKIAQQKLDAEVEEKRKTIQDEVKKFEEQITLLETETRREQEELEKSVNERQERQKLREVTAAKTLQAGFRGYRVRKTSQPVLHQKREERAKEREQKRIDEVEKDIQEKKEAKEREEEQKRIEKEKQEEEERKLREEKAKLDEERKQKEEKKLEKERKKREEEIKLAEEKRKKEDEKRRIEKKKEEEKLLEKKKEEERIENERKERERKRIEADRIEKERKEQEEKERKEEEERVKREEERKVQEEREKKQKLEEEKFKEEKRLREENERLKEELKMIKEQTNTAENDSSPTKKKIESISSSAMENTQSKGNDIATENKKSSSEIRKSVSEKRQQFERAHAQDEDTLGRTLPQHIEAKRLAWIKECLPWSKISNEPWKLKGGVSKKPPRRPASAKKLPPLAEDVIITAARVATLKQVTTVQLSDLPGCNLSTFGQCWGLKSLTMTNCNLVALDSLQQCRQLQYLCVKRNKLEYIDLKDLGNLQVVDLSNNNLSVVHGLDGCTNIRWLDLSCNRVTRLGGLDPLRRLHTLLLSSNQLITCSGISDVPTLQHLDLSNNHLQELDSLHKLCLLQRLNVSANNLLQFPDVRNQVLLEECDMSDNSISSLDGVTSYWLPMLTKLNISKNSLNELEVLDNLILLTSLDVSNNQLLDLETILSALSCLVQLEELCVLENPATDGTTYKEKLRQMLPRLGRLDGDGVESREDAVLHPHTDFEAMCRTHAHFHNSIRHTFLQELQSIESKSPVDDLALCEAYFRYCDKSFKLAVEHRYAHEYGEVSINIPVAPSTPKSGRPRSVRAKILHTEAETYLSPKEMFEKALKSDSQSADTGLRGMGTVMDNPKDLFEKALKSSGSGVAPHHGAGQPVEDPKNMFAKALELQSAKQIESGKDAFEKAVQNVQPKTDERIDLTPTAWPRNSSQTDVNLRASLQNLPPDEIAILEELHSSATKIQALWRGYILRLKLAAALEYARMEGEDDISELDDFNMDDITFDEESLEKGWRPTETPQIPHSHPVLGKPPTGRQGADVLKLELAPVHPPNRPRHAWRNMDSPLSDLVPHPPRPPSSVMSASDTHRTGGLSKREEKLAEEWGFHNSRTAELMLQRAKKMKLNSDRKRKLSRLDPKQRLALFRKLEEVTKLSPIRAPARKTLPRKEYFQAREEEVQRKEFEKRREAQTRTTRTYEWLHTQVASLDTPADRHLDRHGSFGSEGNLAAATSEVLGPHRMQMMQHSGYDVDVFGEEEQRTRRFSSGESISTSGQTTYLPPIKTNSAGSNGSNGGPRRKEKMSWRNQPTEVDVGWGGGRKRQTNK